MATIEYARAVEFHQRAARRASRRRVRSNRSVGVFAAALRFAGTLFIGFGTHNLTVAQRTPALTVTAAPTAVPGDPSQPLR